MLKGLPKKLADNITDENQHWWKTINTIRGYNQNNINDVPLLKNVDDQYIHVDYDTANVLNDYYCETDDDQIKCEIPVQKYIDFNSIPIVPKHYYPKNKLSPHTQLTNPELSYGEYYKQQLRLLNQKISINEINYTIKSFGKHKNPGPGINIEIITKSGNSIVLFMHWMFNIFFSYKYLPKLLKLRYIKPIIKPSKNPHIITNYRQISLFGYTAKIYEKILSIRITYYVIDNQLINRNHMVFLNSKNAEDVLTIFTNNIYNGFSKKIPTYSIFLTLSVAMIMFIMIFCGDYHNIMEQWQYLKW